MSELNTQYFKVLDYNPAAQNVQGMESRDFQYKGIYRFFSIVSEWTEKYLANKILPNVDQIGRELGADKDKIEFFINELCFKPNPPIVKKITTVEFEVTDTKKSDNLTSGIKRNTVFARPSALDAGSCQRYINGCNDRSVEAIKRGIAERRTTQHGDKFKEFIFNKVNANKLSETYASFDIGNLFNCPYDINKQLREVTVNVHLKPVLKKLVDDKVLLFFRNEKAPKASNKSIFLYNNKDEVIERIEIYVNYMKKNIVPALQKIGVISAISEEEYADFSTLANRVLVYLDDSYEDQKVLVEEIIILGGFYESYRDEMKKKEVKDKIAEVVRLVEGAGKIVDMSAIRVNGEPIPKDLIPSVIANENLLYTEYNDGSSYFEFLLHKDCVNMAADLARKVFASTGNDTDIRILTRMNITGLLDENLKKDFSRAETESLFKYLPLLTRMWRLLMGNIFVTREEAEQIRIKKEMEQKKRINEAKSKIIAKEKSKIVEERMKQISSEETGGSAAVSDDDKIPADENKKLSFEEERQVKEMLHYIIRKLDSAWDMKVFPDREYLVKALEGEMNEEQLVAFLKKYSTKDILSFTVKSKVNKYKWPILVSRSYLRRRGRALLELAKREADTERGSITPDQEKFDMYNSLEDFLDKVLTKI